MNAVLGGKRLLLFKQMCIDAKVGDESLFDELTQGFRLTGTMSDSRKFPKKLKPAGITVEQLRESSVWAKKMIHSSCRKVSADACSNRELRQLPSGLADRQSVVNLRGVPMLQQRPKTLRVSYTPQTQRSFSPTSPVKISVREDMHFAKIGIPWNGARASGRMSRGIETP